MVGDLDLLMTILKLRKLNLLVITNCLQLVAGMDKQLDFRVQHIFQITLKNLFTFDTKSNCLQHVALWEENGVPVGILAVKCCSAVLGLPFIIHSLYVLV